jgi:2,2-dialkylglycine decarboxylase (pyruvate)
VLKIVIRDKLSERARSLGASARWVACPAAASRLHRRVRGRGLLVGLDLVQDRVTKAPAPEFAHRVARNCLELGMMTSVVRGGLGIFRIAPPITISKEEMELPLDIFDAAIRNSLA